MHAKAVKPLCCRALPLRPFLFRQWYLTLLKFPLGFTPEFKLVEGLLARDVRNNSAWNHRWFVGQYAPGAAGGEEKEEEAAEPVKALVEQWTEEKMKAELAFVVAKLKIVRGNESAWNYARGYVAILVSC